MCETALSSCRSVNIIKARICFFAKIKSYSPRYIQDAALEKSVCTSWGVDSHHESASLYLMARKQYDMRSLLNASKYCLTNGSNDERDMNRPSSFLIFVGQGTGLVSSFCNV